jgi:RNA polymerase sigma-70 factor (ECF subfamily)
MMTAATLTFGPGRFMTDHVSPRTVTPAAMPGGAGNALTSVELLARARGGDEEALNDLCARYLPRLQKWAHGRLPSWARGALDTHDIVQDTLAQVIQGLGSFEPRHDGAFQAYLRQALLNRVRDQMRWAQRRPTDALASNRPDEGPSPIEEAIGSEAVARYEAALQRLKPSDREAIIARIELGHSYPDVARALGKPTVAAAHVAVSRALVKLAKEMSLERKQS